MKISKKSIFVTHGQIVYFPWSKYIAQTASLRLFPFDLDNPTQMLSLKTTNKQSKEDQKVLIQQIMKENRKFQQQQRHQPTPHKVDFCIANAHRKQLNRSSEK